MQTDIPLETTKFDCCGVFKLSETVDPKSVNETNNNNDDGNSDTSSIAYQDQDHFATSDDELDPQQEEHFANLILIRDHPARQRRRSSQVPSTTAIVEDHFLEQLCHENKQEPDLPADRLSRSDRKTIVRKMSRSGSITTSDIKRLGKSSRSDSIHSMGMQGRASIINSQRTSLSAYNRGSIAGGNLHHLNQKIQPSADEISAKRIENWRRLSLTSNSMSGAIADAVTDVSKLRNDTFAVHEDISDKKAIEELKNILLNTESEDTLESTFNEDGELLNLAQIHRLSQKLPEVQQFVSECSQSTLSMKKPSCYSVDQIPKKKSNERSISNDNSRVSDPGNEQICSAINGINSISFRASSADRSSHNGSSLGGNTRRRSLIPDENEDHSLLSRQKAGRRKSIKNYSKIEKPKTTGTGQSQYPLPGSKIPTSAGGNFKTTKTTSNLLSENEINEIVIDQNQERANSYGVRKLSVLGMEISLGPSNNKGQEEKQKSNDKNSKISFESRASASSKVSKRSGTKVQPTLSSNP